MPKFYIFPMIMERKNSVIINTYILQKIPFVKLSRLQKNDWIMTEFHILMDQGPGQGALERILLTSVTA